MQPKPNPKLQNKVIGNYGELIAAKHLKDRGFKLIEMNYLRKWGEIDVIVEKAKKIHFVEVKTVSYETKADLDQAVARGTWRPEENVHALKLKKLARAINSWIADHQWKGEWQIDVAAVKIVPRETFATIILVDNIILD